MVLEMWLLEIVKGIGKLFLNPLLYWTIILFILTGYKRIRRERNQFGTKIYHMFTEGRHTFVISILFSIIISILTISFGIVISFEAIIILMIVMFVLSITGSTMMLSASYTIGITFLLLLILPFINMQQLNTYINFQDLSAVHFIGLAILTGLFLVAEALLIAQRDRETFPMMTLSGRGIWIGQHQLKRLAFIPFFVLLPAEKLAGIAPLFPYFEYGNQSFSLILLPFFVGFQYKVQGELPHVTAQKLGQKTLLLSWIVLLFAIGSLFFPVLSLVAILIAIIGKEFLTYRLRLKDRKRQAVFTPLHEGVKVLATIPNSPADRLGILVGETILKVNGTVVTNSVQFYEALQNSGAFFKLDILDDNGEVRFISSALYEEDHYKLGIIFPEEPTYRS